MGKLIFDIETVGEDFNAYDETTKNILTRWINKEGISDEERSAKIDEVRDGLGLSPLTGQIVAIGVLDYDKIKGGVYFQAPGESVAEKQIDGINYLAGSEKEILEKFWGVVSHYQEFVSFNGRGFDAPYLMIRSAVHKIKPTKDLMSNRYLNSQKFDCKHYDLMDLLSFYGVTQNRGRGLHMYCRAFGITSPKTDGHCGEDVGKLFKDNKFMEIAEYNAKDLYATRGLFEYWEKYLKF
jgi:DNA polymerase elongation subunit (family B)